jgi:hypothetical protein
MATPLNQVFAGRLNDFDDSLAQEIEIAMNSLSGPLPSAPQELVNDRRRLFIAIANGVINHLQKHSAAVAVTLDGGGNHITTINVRL